MLAFLTISAAAESEAETRAFDDTRATVSADEYRIQRRTWLGVVAVLVIADIFPDWLSPHHGVTPLAAGIVFLVSGLMRRRRGLSVRLSIWIASALLLVTAGFNFFSWPALDLSLIVVVSTAMVIALSIFGRKS